MQHLGLCGVEFEVGFADIGSVVEVSVADSMVHDEPIRHGTLLQWVFHCQPADADLSGARGDVCP